MVYGREQLVSTQIVRVRFGGVGSNPSCHGFLCVLTIKASFWPNRLSSVY